VKWLIEQSRYLAYFIVLAFLVAAVFSIFWGITKTVKVAMVMIESAGQDDKIASLLVQVLDAFLLAIGFLIFAASVFELLIANVNLPDWMIAHNFDELKTKLSGIIILVVAVKAVERLAESKDYQDLLAYSLAATLVILSLVVFTYFTKKTNSAKLESKPIEKDDYDQ
jgi:uncharacterized membrane protein YqhA